MSTIDVGLQAGLPATFDPLDPSRCVVLVPIAASIEPPCEEGLYQLQRRGYPVWRVRGFAAIDQGRNQMAADALRQGFAETMWIDSDIAFDPDDVERLRRHQLPVVSAIYPKKGQRALASHVLPGTEKLVFGAGGGLVELAYAATGFLLVRREVYETVQAKLELPDCNQRFGKSTIPFFQPMVIPDGDARWYLAEDYAFSERLRQCGFKIYADTRIRLGHVGRYTYTWEDAGTERRKFATYHFHLGGKTAANDEQQKAARAASEADGAEPLVGVVTAGLPNRYLPYHFPGGKIFLNVAQSAKMVTSALGLYQPYQSRAVLSYVKPGMTFVDVGAALGYFALMAARAVGAQGRVVAVEPVPEHVRWLRKSAELNGYDWLHAVPVAVGASNEPAAMYGDELTGSYSLVPDPSRPASRDVPVQLRTLDDVLDELNVPRVDLLRINVSGAEKPFIEGAVRTLSADHPQRLVLDLHPRPGTDAATTCELLKEYGYTLYDVRHPGERPLTISPDLRSLVAQK